MPTDTGFKIRPSTSSDAVEFHADQVTVDGTNALMERVKVSFGDPGSATDASATNPLPVAPASAGDIASTLANGRKTVTTPGTAVALETSSTPCKWVAVTALLTNTKPVSLGASGVLASGSATGIALQPGSSTTLPVSDASHVFVDAQVAGEGVSFLVGS